MRSILRLSTGGLRFDDAGFPECIVAAKQADSTMSGFRPLLLSDDGRREGTLSECLRQFDFQVEVVGDAPSAVSSSRALPARVVGIEVGTAGRIRRWRPAQWHPIPAVSQVQITASARPEGFEPPTPGSEDQIQRPDTSR